MERFFTIHTAQELFKILSDIPSSMRDRMQVIAVSSDEVEHQAVDVEAVNIIEGGAEVTMLRLTMNGSAA